MRDRVAAATGADPRGHPPELEPHPPRAARRPHGVRLLRRARIRSRTRRRWPTSSTSTTRIVEVCARACETPRARLGPLGARRRRRGDQPPRARPRRQVTAIGWNPERHGRPVGTRPAVDAGGRQRDRDGRRVRRAHGHDRASGTSATRPTIRAAARRAFAGSPAANASSCRAPPETSCRGSRSTTRSSSPGTWAGAWRSRRCTRSPTGPRGRRG